MRITALQPQARKRVAVHLDGVPALALSSDVCARFGLRTGDEISAGGLAQLQAAEVRHSALASALRLLSYRPRTEGEMRDRLTRKGVAPDVVESVIVRLRELRLLDDAAFSRSWVENRNLSSPRGRRLIVSELRAKRIGRRLADSSVAAVDEEDAAYRACARRARSLAGLPWRDFRRRLGDFLLRRGFEYETARAAIARTWGEMNGKQPGTAAGEE